MAIGSFKYKGLAQFYQTGSTRGIAAKSADKLNDMLTALDEAETVDELALFTGWASAFPERGPGWPLEHDGHGKPPTDFPF